MSAGMQFVNAKGKPVATFMATGRTDIQSMTSEFEIHRGALAKIFIDPVLKDTEHVQLIYDEYVDDFTCTSDNKVDVTFANSKQTKTYDLLVAADGLGSSIRGKMFGTPPREQVYDEGVHAAYFTIKNRDLLAGSKLAKWHNASRGRSVFLRPDPAGHTRGHLMNVVSDFNGDTKRKLEQALKDGNEAYMSLLEEEFLKKGDEVGWLTPEVLKGMRESEDFYCSLFAQTRAPKLCNEQGNVVLLGDAGYATPGFGTSLAIIGGYVLAGEMLRHGAFSDTPGELPGGTAAASKAYEALVLPFVKENQGGDYGIYFMQMFNPQTWWGISIRNAILGFISWARIDYYGVLIAAKLGFGESGLKMPDYRWPVEEKKNGFIS